MDGLVAVRCWLRDSKHRHVGTRACWSMGQEEEGSGRNDLSIERCRDEVNAKR